MGTVLYYLIVVVSSWLFCLAVVTYLKRPFFKLVVYSTSQLDVIFDKSLKEEEKDKKLIKNLIQVLRYFLSCLIIIGFLVIGVISTFTVYIYFNGKLEIDLSSVYFYASMIIGSIPIFRSKKNGNYSYWSKLLHTIVLDNYSLGKYLLKKEFDKKISIQDTENQDFTIVTGLARSGTTALTNLIFDEKHFHSIRYSNVPFLMSPNLWKRIYNPKKTKAQKRAHQDGILFTLRSVEALEEYFFKTQLNDNYITDQALIKHYISKELYERYVNYQDLFKEKDTTYLAKNNNFLLRYESIRAFNKCFSVFLLFRNPIDHAKSLLRQHQNFLQQQNDNEFVLSYMNWLGHHEFGINHKHFDFRQSDKGNLDRFNKDELSFWLQVWINYYRYVVEIHNKTEKLFLIHFEDLAKNPIGLKSVVGRIILRDLEIGSTQSFQHAPSNLNNFKGVDHVLLTEAKELYEKLQLNRIKVSESPQQ